MSDKTSQALIGMLNEITNIETELSKVEAAIFVKKSNELMQEKIAYLYNLLQAEAKNCNQKSDERFTYIERVISLYRDKLNIVYDEVYLQYVNIQNEINEARLNQKEAVINYQKIINNAEFDSEKYDKLKIRLKNKNELYEKVIEKCRKQSDLCISNFEKQISINFLITSTLPVTNDGFFEKIKKFIFNLFNGTKKYISIIEEYERNINNIGIAEIISNMRKETVKFIADILEMKETYADIDKAF